MDGRYLFSNIIPVDRSVSAVSIKVTPNPAAGSAMLSFTSDRNAGVSVRLIDLTGNSVWNRQYQAGRGINTLQLDHLEKLPNGLYILQLYNGENYEKVKMLIRH